MAPTLATACAALPLEPQRALAPELTKAALCLTGGLAALDGVKGSA